MPGPGGRCARDGGCGGCCAVSPLEAAVHPVSPLEAGSRSRPPACDAAEGDRPSGSPLKADVRPEHQNGGAGAPRGARSAVLVRRQHQRWPTARRHRFGNPVLVFYTQPRSVRRCRPAARRPPIRFWCSTRNAEPLRRCRPAARRPPTPFWCSARNELDRASSDTVGRSRTPLRARELVRAAERVLGTCGRDRVGGGCPMWTEPSDSWGSLAAGRDRMGRGCPTGPERRSGCSRTSATDPFSSW